MGIWVLYIAPTENLYSELPAQVYTLLQNPCCHGKWLGRQRVGSDMGGKGRAVGERG